MMKKKIIIVVAGLFISVGAFGARVAEPALLEDGFVLRGINGEVNGPDANNGWFFRFNEDVNDDKGVVKAGTNLELLPSTTLEKMTADVNERASIDYRLWGKVTRYKGKNFIFPTYFLPLIKMETPQSQMLQTQEPSPQESWPAEIISAKERGSAQDINEPNDVLNIPQEIIGKLRTRRIAQPSVSAPEEVNAVEQKSGVVEGREAEPKLKKRPELRQDAILADRTALLVKQDNGGLAFVLDALGLNAPQVSLRVLPCAALELTEQRQSLEPETVPFKIAGITTKYKGKYYLLLQKATRVYSYGNFGG
ncbi:MAG: hypothetical protein NTX52_13290 [Planctomycetota bacterium]|nr:hypothetical protein [Planctomycetota bacterium]